MPLTAPKRTWALALAPAAAVLLAAGSAAAGDNSLRARFHPLPAAPVGAETCTGCHEELAAGFAKTIHSRLTAAERAGLPGGCEGCHGPGSRHADTQDPALIRRFGPDYEAAATTCTFCHKGQELADWTGSEHDLAGVDCSDCHQIHRSGHGAVGPDRCGKCHGDVIAAFRLPSHHPVLERKMGCDSCHEPHGRHGQSLKTSERPNDLCFECHAAQQGPFVYEHEPVVEDCGICHSPHGTVANFLLQQNQPFLCLTCHDFHFHAGLEADDDHEVEIRGTRYANPYGRQGYKMAFTTSCTQCHAQIHGSDLPSQGISSRGRALTR